MEALRALNEELGSPGVAKLLAAAKKKGIKATKDEAREVQGDVKQLFAKAPDQKGAIATNDNGSVWQADLADLTQYSKKNNKDHSYFLLVVDVFSREIQTEPLETKKPQEVWIAFTTILDRFGKKCQRLDTDDGNEFSGHFQEEAAKKGIIVQTKEKEDINGIAVNDAAMKNIKEIMFRMLAKDNTTSWINFLSAATSAYNKTPHGTTYGAPEDVADESIVKFRLLQDNAEKLKRNSKQLKQRQEKLEAAGAFRPMLPRSEWQRAFKPRYSGTVLKNDGIEGGFVKSGGKRYAISRVQPVLGNQPSRPLPAALAKGSEKRNEANKEALKQYVAPLKTFLKGGAAKDLSAIGRHMADRWEFTENIKKLRLRSVKDFIQLYPDEFQITSSGKVQLRNTRPAVRLRLG